MPMPPRDDSSPDPRSGRPGQPQWESIARTSRREDMQFINTPFRAVAAAAVVAASALVSTTASADSLAYAVNGDNWTFSGTSQVDVAGMVSNVFTKPANARLVITFSAECAVDAPAGNPNAWMDVDIVLLNPT